MNRLKNIFGRFSTSGPAVPEPPVPPPPEEYLEGGAGEQNENTNTTIPDSIIHDLCHSFTFQKNNLYPVSNHRSYRLFKRDEIKAHVTENIVGENFGDVHEIDMSSNSEFHSEFSTKVGIGLGSVLPVAEFEFGALRNTKNLESSDFHQRRKYHSEKYVEDFAPFSTEEELKRYLDDRPYEDLMKIGSISAASEFLKTYGRFYISRPRMGGLSVSFRRNQMQETTSERTDQLQGTVSDPIQNAGQLDGGYTRQQTNLVAGTIGENRDRKIGGDTRIQDEAEWIASIEDKNCVICNCRFCPLYQLIDGALPETDDLSKIREHLEDAHNSPIGDRCRYTIRNRNDTPIFIVSQPREKPLKPGLRVDPNQPTENCVFTAVLISHDGPKQWSLSFHDNSFERLPDAPLRLNYFFGRRNWNKTEVKMSSKGDECEQNRWTLVKQKNDCHYTLRCEEGNKSYVLGVKQKIRKKIRWKTPDEMDESRLLSGLPRLGYQYEAKHYYKIKEMEDGKPLTPSFKWQINEISP